MARTVTGTLTLPNGDPMANAEIVWTARDTSDSVIAGAVAVVSADALGAYSWSIEDGLYGVSILYGGRRWPLGDVTIAPGDPIDLDDLLTES